MKSNWKQGEQYVWASAAAVCLTLLMVAVLIAVVMFNGLGYFWPPDLAQLELRDGTSVLGQVMGQEEGVLPAQPNLRLKVGNRDLYGQDFRWVQGETIAGISYPADAVLLERVEYGNFHGFLVEFKPAGAAPASSPGDDWGRLRMLLESVRGQMEPLAEGKQKLAEMSRDIESLRTELRHGSSDSGSGEQKRKDLRRSELAMLEQRYKAGDERHAALETQLRMNRAILRDAGGKRKEIALVDIVRAVRPNAMSIWAKIGFYLSKVSELLLDEPRESNTEGGLFPAIFGTVMMVMIMSVFSLPMGVVAAIYLREYAREGILVKLVRIAVYNLAGVPSIVFGVFGLSFFIYGVGGGLDGIFFSDRLPTPTFGTGGILWASLTLALLTVPVVIVATEEGLSAIPRGIREASLALGATRFQTLLRVVMPMAVPGILTGFILAMSRAAGEVAPLMITGVVKLAPALPIDATFPYLHLERKFMHLGFHIYDVGFQSPNVEAAKPMVYITTLLLVLIVLMLSLTAILLRNRMRKRMQTTTF